MQSHTYDAGVALFGSPYTTLFQITGKKFLYVNSYCYHIQTPFLDFGFISVLYSILIFV